MFLKWHIKCSISGKHITPASLDPILAITIYQTTSSAVSTANSFIHFYPFWPPMKATYYYTMSQKTSHLWLAITLTHMNGFWYFFGRNVTDEVGNQKTLYYTISSNLCFWTIWQNEEMQKSHFHSDGLCYTHNALVCCLPERKSCHLWCVW